MSISSEGLPAKQMSPEERKAMREAFDEEFSDDRLQALARLAQQQEAEPTWPEIVESHRKSRGLDSLSNRQLSEELRNRAVREGSALTTDQAAFNLEAAARLEQLENLDRLLGSLAPGGTAPKTAIEEIFRQSQTNADESQIVVDLRAMLRQHWGAWTPALLEAFKHVPAETPEQAE